MIEHIKLKPASLTGFISPSPFPPTSKIPQIYDSLNKTLFNLALFTDSPKNVSPNPGSFPSQKKIKPEDENHSDSGRYVKILFTWTIVME